MWQRFTERARIAIYLAQEEARGRGVRDVETQHLLAGLLREPPAPEGIWPPAPTVPNTSHNGAAAVLKSLGLDCDKICAALDKELNDGEITAKINDMRLSGASKQAIDLAYNEARQLHHSDIRPEHLLLGVIAQETGIAAQTLFQHGVTLEQAREKVRYLTNSRDATADRKPRWWGRLFGRR